MRIIDRSRTDFDRAKIKLTAQFDRGPISRRAETRALIGGGGGGGVNMHIFVFCPTNFF